MSVYAPTTALLSGVADRAPAAHAARHRATWLLAATVIGLGALAFQLSSRGPEAITPLAYGDGITSRRPALVASSVTVERREGYLVLQAEVSNVGQSGLRNIEAIVEYYDKDGKLRRVESGLLYFASLRAGEASPLRILAEDDPSVRHYRLRFGTILGASIASLETR